MKNGWSAGLGSIPIELIQAGITVIVKENYRTYVKILLQQIETYNDICVLIQQILEKKIANEDAWKRRMIQYGALNKLKGNNSLIKIVTGGGGVENVSYPTIIAQEHRQGCRMMWNVEKDQQYWYFY